MACQAETATAEAAQGNTAKAKLNTKELAPKMATEVTGGVQAAFSLWGVTRLVNTEDQSTQTLQSGPRGQETRTYTYGKRPRALKTHINSGTLPRPEKVSVSKALPKGRLSIVTTTINEIRHGSARCVFGPKWAVTNWNSLGDSAENDDP